MNKNESKYYKSAEKMHNALITLLDVEVDFCWSRWCSSEMFDSECRKYDLSPIKNVTSKQHNAL